MSRPRLNGEESLEGLYSHPLYYDIAFSWDLSAEIAFFGRVFESHVPFPVRRILEPCCGSGRFLVALPKHGYSVMGYDVSQEMLEYARRRIADVGDPLRARAVPGDMRTARFEREFDAALNSINSLGYLTSDDEIVTHFANTGASLRPGGVYIVHVSCAWDGEPALDHNTWEMERDGVRVRTKWRIEREDRDARLSHQRWTLSIDDGGRRVELEGRDALRLWIYDELRALVESSRTLTMAALYSEGFEPLPLDTRVSGEMGNLYYILKAR